MGCPLTLSDARYERQDGYPLLLVTVDGRPAVLDAYPKPTLHLAGLVFVGSEFEDVLPPIDFKPADGGWTRLRGVSDDPRLWRLYDRFLRACESGAYRVGSVSIPD